MTVHNDNTNDRNTDRPNWEEIAKETEQFMLMLDPAGERIYDLRDKSFEQLVEFLGDLADSVVPTHIIPRFDSIELLKFYTELFTKPEILHTRFPEKIDRVFDLIGNNYNAYGVSALIENPDIPLQHREDCIRAMYYLHERLLTMHNIESIYWLWGDLCKLRVGRSQDKASARDYASENHQLLDVVFETLGKILVIESSYCQHTALRAMNDLKHPDTQSVVDAYLLSHPDLPSRDRKYALAVTQDVLYDISNASFDEFLDYIFDHPAYEGLWDFDPVSYDAIKSARYFIQLFNEPRFLFQKYSRDQLEKGFWAIQSCNLEISAGKLVATRSIPLNLRLNLIQDVGTLYEKLFAIDPMENAAYMWWDGMIADYWVNSKLSPEEDSAIKDGMLETLGLILEIESPICKSAALHGLGHLKHSGTEALIRSYLERHPESGEGMRRAALACIKGDIM